MVKLYNYDETKCTADFNLSSHSLSTMFTLILYFEFKKLQVYTCSLGSFLSTRFIQLVELRRMRKLRRNLH